MVLRALSAQDVAAELGRSPDWLAENWRRLVRERKFPKPLHDTGPLAWSAPAVHAWTDRELTPEMRARAAAYRAAYEAAANPASVLGADDVAEARARLDQRFGGGAAS